MKIAKMISCLLFMLTIYNCSPAKAQELNLNNDTTWVYKVDNKVASQASEPGTFNTDVFIYVNPKVVSDSSLFIIKIGTTEGESNIFYKEYRYTLAIYNNPEVVALNGYIRIYVGQFVMPETPYLAVLDIMVP